MLEEYTRGRIDQDRWEHRRKRNLAPSVRRKTKDFEVPRTASDRPNVVRTNSQSGVVLEVGPTVIPKAIPNEIPRSSDRSEGGPSGREDNSRWRQAGPPHRSRYWEGIASIGRRRGPPTNERLPRAPQATPLPLPYPCRSPDLPLHRLSMGPLASARCDRRRRSQRRAPERDPIFPRRRAFILPSPNHPQLQSSLPTPHWCYSRILFAWRPSLELGRPVELQPNSGLLRGASNRRRQQRLRLLQQR